MTQGYQTLEQAREAAKQNPTTVLYRVLAVVHLESGLYHFIVPGVVALESMENAIVCEMWRLTEDTIWEQIFPTIEEVPPSMSKDETYEIIGSRWFTNLEYLGIGVVAIRTHNPHSWGFRCFRERLPMRMPKTLHVSSRSPRGEVPCFPARHMGSFLI